MSSLLDDINLIIPELFEERLFPCNIVRDVNGKKVVQQPKGWTDATKLYEDFELSGTNSIAVRTGKGLVVVDVDTKDLTLLEPYMKDLVNKWLSDKATFIVETTNGYHFYFDSDDTSYSNAVRVSDYVDIRGDGGCVFCFSEDENSSYSVLSSAEPLPLTLELLKYLKEKDNVSVAYFFNDNRKIAVKNGLPNPTLQSAVNTGLIDNVIKAASKSFNLEDFNTGADGLYSSVNKLIYTLAINPSVENKYVDVIVELLVTQKLGFDMNSPKTKKRLSQIYSTLIWANEEDVTEVSEEDIFEEESSIEEEELVQDIDNTFTIPEALEECNRLYNWLILSDIKTNAAAALTTLFTIVSAVTARGYYTHTIASTPLFIILISPTGSGKNMVAKAPEKLMRLLGRGDKIVASKISSEGAMDDIFKVQNILIHIIDEFGDQLGQMMSDKAGYLKVIAAKMKSLYSLTDGTYNSARYSSAGGKNRSARPWTMQRPCYGLTGMTTKVQLLSQLNDAMLHDGFLNRFIILDGQNAKPQFNSSPLFSVPDEIVNHIKSLTFSKLYREPMDKDEEPYGIDNSDLNYCREEEYKVIKLSPKASVYFHSYIGDPDIESTDIYKFCKDDETEVKRAISIRWRENSLRLATALAAYEKLDTVSIDVLQWCYKLVKGSSINFLSMFEKEIASTKYELQKAKALQWFKKQGPEKWFTLSHLARFARPFSSLNSSARKELLSDLVESEILESKSNIKDKTTVHLYKLTN